MTTDGRRTSRKSDFDLARRVGRDIGAVVELEQVGVAGAEGNRRLGKRADVRTILLDGATEQTVARFVFWKGKRRGGKGGGLRGSATLLTED